MKLINIRKFCSYWKEVILISAICITFFVIADAYFPDYENPFNPKYEGKQISRTEVAEYQYVASVLREPFHDPNCRWAKRINPENLIGFKTRQEALDSGRRPCKVCKP